MHTKPIIYLTPYAFAKLQFWRDAGDTEITCFAVDVARTDGSILIVDYIMPGHDATVVSVDIEADDLADLMEEAAAAGIDAARLTRLWQHTHPGDSASPSSVDEAQCREFAGGDWHAMLILAKGGEWYARIDVAGPVPHSTLCDVRIDWQADSPAVDDFTRKEWQATYDDRCRIPAEKPPKYAPTGGRLPAGVITPSHARTLYSNHGWPDGDDYTTDDDYWNGRHHERPDNPIDLTDLDDGDDPLATSWQFSCNNCGHIWEPDDKLPESFDFCPNCKSNDIE